MRSGPLLAFAAAALVVAGAPDARAEGDKPGACAALKGDQQTLDRSREVVVWKDTNDRFLACRFEHPRAVVVEESSGSSSGLSIPDAIEVTGHWALVRNGFFYPGDSQPAFAGLNLYDLGRGGRTARRVRSVNLEDVRGDGTTASAIDLAVNGRGGAAWAGVDGVFAFRPGRQVCRLSARGIDHGSLTLGPNAVRWSAAGVEHRVPLGPAPREER